MRLVSLATALICAAAAAQAHGQTFDTASVKPNQSATCDRDGTLAGGRFAMTCSTLRELITFAYPRQNGRVRADAEITGGPSWINADHFDVIGKIPEGRGLGFDAGNTASASVTSTQLSAIDQVRAMVRALLVDRFKLAVRNDTRELPAYDLQVDRTDGRLGPRLKKVDADCASRRGTGRLCGGFRTMAPGHVVGGAVPMSLLAQFLELSAGRNVFDRTGLQGAFDLELEYAPDRVQLRGPNAPAPDPAGVSVFTALKEQLGLKLESTKTPIDVLVIDHADKPTPD